MTDAVVAEVEVAAPADVVWRALREPAELRRWHGWDFDGLDEEIDFIYLGGREVDDARMTLDTGGGVWALEARGERTVVRVTRSTPDDGWDDPDSINEGWLAFAQQLRFYLERHRGEARRTIHVDREIPLPDGEPWHRAAHQAGVVLDDGDVLAIAFDGRTVASAYGLDDEALAALDERLEAAG
jgi:uncharacterized protein YndB with AHSA1/START domain